MKFAQFDQDGINLIEAYDQEHIRINGRDYRAGLVVTAETVVPDWGPRQIADLDSGHVEALLASQPQVVVIGTGACQQFPDPALYFSLLERGIGVEIMDTGAACRTYNILVSEGRRVVAALILD
ncbi:MAG: Mth938-like domain-containing protein [Thiohalocapsa sp.]